MLSAPGPHDDQLAETIRDTFAKRSRRFFPIFSMAGLDPATQSPCVGMATKPLRGVMRGGTVYILASRRNGTLYIGVTYNLAERLFQHRTGRGSKFVQKYGVLTLVWYEHYSLYLNAI